MFTSEAELEAALCRPSPELIEDIASHSGDLLILGAGGKMGPTLATLARRAFNEAGRAEDQIITVSRWSDTGAARRLADEGITVIAADLLEPDSLLDLPDADDVLFMVGAKFGAASSPSWAWQVNSALPDRVARRFRDSRITAFSTGNVYPFVTVASGGSIESDELDPRGDYAMSCLGRERIFEYAAETAGTPIGIIRLNYAVDLRYGVLCDLGVQLLAGEPIDITTNHANVVWQGYANEVTLRALTHAHPDVYRLNLTGPEILNLRQVADQLAGELAVTPTYVGTPVDSQLLNNAAQCFAEFGYPSVPAATLIQWQAEWLRQGLPTSGKPTKFAVRDGKF